jgi:hypothetical protein
MKSVCRSGVKVAAAMMPTAEMVPVTAATMTTAAAATVTTAMTALCNREVGHAQRRRENHGRDS